MFLLFVTSIVLSLVIGGIYAVVMISPHINFDPPMWLLVLVIQVLSFGVPTVIYCAIHRDKIKEILPMRRLGGLNVLMIVGMSLVIQPLFMLINLLSQFLFPNYIADVIADIALDGGLFVTLGIVAVVPSIFEEISFRGAGFAGFKHVNIRTAALINGLMFGMIHMNMNQFLYAFLLGAVFCYFMYYTKSLWAPILAHFIFNGTQSLIAFLALSFDPYALEAAEMAMSADSEMLFASLFLGIIAVAFTAGFIAIFIAFKKHNLKRNEAEGIVTDTAAACIAEGGTRPKAFTWAFWVVVGLFGAMMLGTYLLPALIYGVDLVAAVGL